MASGASDAVGEIPPVSDAASKGRCCSAEALSPAKGALSRREHPAIVSVISSAIKGATNPATPRPLCAFDNFIRQSCRSPSLLHKSQDGCHRWGPIYQLFSLMLEMACVDIAVCPALVAYFATGRLPSRAASLESTNHNPDHNRDRDDKS